MILHIQSAAVCGPHQLRLRFNNGIEKCVDLSGLLDGPVFEPLRDARLFAQVKIDPVCQTVVWPNGADFAPEALLDLPAVAEEGVASPDSLSR
jgi:Protein of unknown function (DUF2442)